MVDDSMEISSDHGHDAGNDDIDIDIDLTAGQVDEDYVLEDVASQDDTGHNISLQPSPLVTADDVMVDDDDGSYSMHDTELMNEGDELLVNSEVGTMSFVTADATPFSGNEHAATAETSQDGHNVEEDLIWDQQDASVPEVDVNDVQLEDSEGTLHHEEIDYSNDPNNETLEPTNLHSDHHSRTATPQQDSPGGLVVEEPRSPPTSNPERQSPHHNPPRHAEPGSSPLEVFNESHKQEEHQSPSRDVEAYDLPGVVVLYQSVEYALFGPPDSENPDSFFLSDLSVAAKSLCDFFKAMREIIHDDLSDDEELCMSIEDLGLEIEETVSSLHDISLANIIQLHKGLLQNDGVEPSRPLYMILGTRTSFAKRLANLMAGVAEGKGLSQVVPWDDQSEELNESNEGEEFNQEYDAIEENELAGETVDNGEDNVEGKLEDGTADHSPEQTEDQADPILSANQAEAHKDDKQSNPTEVQERITHSALSHGSEPQKGLGNNSEVDEDGDLIDYSDEEIEEIEGISRNGSGGPAEANKTNNVAEYQAINEEMRRRSISRASEHTLLDQGKEHRTSNPEPLDKYQKLSESPVEVEDQNEDEWVHGAVEEDQDHLSGHYFEGSGDYNDGDPADDDGEGKLIDTALGTIVAGLANTRHSPPANEDNQLLFEAEIGFEDETEDHIPDEAGSSVNKDPQYSTFTTSEKSNPHDANFTVAKPEPVDTIQPSTPVNATEYQDNDGLDIYGDTKLNDHIVPSENNEPIAEIDHLDEIDYEDDDEAPELKITGELPKTLEQSPVANGGSAKRARSDADVDDVLTTRSKDAKRARS